MIHQQNLALLHRFNTEVEARLLKAMLNERGIPSEIVHSSIGSVLPMLQFSYDLYVREQSMETSQIILKNFQEPNGEEPKTRKLNSKLFGLVVAGIIVLYLSVVLGMKLYSA